MLAVRACRAQSAIGRQTASTCERLSALPPPLASSLARPQPSSLARPQQVSVQYSGGRGAPSGPAWGGKEGVMDLLITENVFYGREAQVGSRNALQCAAMRLQCTA